METTYYILKKQNKKLINYTNKYLIHLKPVCKLEQIWTIYYALINSTLEYEEDHM